MIELFLGGLWFIAPAILSNGAPVVVKSLRFLDPLNKPLDHGRKLKGKRVFGPNKTYRGLAAGVAVAALFGLIQYLLAENFAGLRELELLEGMTMSKYLLLGSLLGLGALLGDASESLVKRQLDIKPGQSWFPYDQLDYIFGALIIALPFGTLNLFEYSAILILGLLIHLVGTFIGYKLGMRDDPL